MRWLLVVVRYIGEVKWPGAEGCQVHCKVVSGPAKWFVLSHHHFLSIWWTTGAMRSINPSCCVAVPAIASCWLEEEIKAMWVPLMVSILVGDSILQQFRWMFRQLTSLPLCKNSWKIASADHLKTTFFLLNKAKSAIWRTPPTGISIQSNRSSNTCFLFLNKSLEEGLIGISQWRYVYGEIRKREWGIPEH